MHGRADFVAQSGWSVTSTKQQHGNLMEIISNNGKCGMSQKYTLLWFKPCGLFKFIDKTLEAYAYLCYI